MARDARSPRPLLPWGGSWGLGFREGTGGRTGLEAPGDSGTWYLCPVPIFSCAVVSG